MEQVDILTPPTFQKSGRSKPRDQAYQDGNWLGIFNLWILQDNPVPAIVYQLRSPHSHWAPNQLDVTAGGHYLAGETIKDGLREVEEELGKRYQFEALTCIGQKIFVGTDTRGNQKNNLIDIFFIKDNAPLITYTLESREVHAITALPVQELIKVHSQPDYSFSTEALNHQGKLFEIQVTQASFPQNWDPYHHKITLLAHRFLQGERRLLY